MNDLTTQGTANLPTTIEDLTRFVLVGREKITAVRAEIRAIDRLQLAQEVRDQKFSEARMLSEALLDAEVKLGELFKLIPKAQGARTDVQLPLSSEQKFEPQPSGGQKLEVQTKEQVTQRLGFDRHQVQRFETLASHPEEVEQIKAEPARTMICPRGRQY